MKSLAHQETGSRRVPYLSTWLGALVILAGCGAEPPPETAPPTGGRAERPPDAIEQDRAEIESVVSAVLAAYGGEANIRRVRAYRASGTITAIQDQTVGTTVRCYQRPDRLRVELRYPERGQVRVTRGDQGWAGRDDTQLTPAGSPFVESMRLQAAGLDIPLRLFEERAALVQRSDDAEGRRVLRSLLDRGLVLDYHIHPDTYRVEEVTLWMNGEASSLAVRVAMSEFRWVDGVLFPFKETVEANDQAAAEVRLREVELNPHLPDALFHSAGH